MSVYNQILLFYSFKFSVTKPGGFLQQYLSTYISLIQQNNKSHANSPTFYLCKISKVQRFICPIELKTKKAKFTFTVYLNWKYEEKHFLIFYLQVNCDDDKLFRVETWFRFKSVEHNQTMRLAENCPSSITNKQNLISTSYCGAQYRGSIQGSHPTVEEG